MKIREILNEDKSVADLNLNYKGGDLFINDNNLTSLEGSPEKITGNFYCFNNKLITLEGGPKIVIMDYLCYNNKLTSLKGNIELIDSDFYCYKNNITTFKNIFKYIKQINGRFFCTDNPIKDGLLHILLIKGIKEIISPFEEIDDIINNYLLTNKPGTPKAMFDVQKLIIEAKLKDVPESVYME